MTFPQGLLVGELCSPNEVWQHGCCVQEGTDGDGDGFAAASDCNDDVPRIYPTRIASVVARPASSRAAHSDHGEFQPPSGIDPQEHQTLPKARLLVDLVEFDSILSWRSRAGVRRAPRRPRAFSRLRPPDCVRRGGEKPSTRRRRREPKRRCRRRCRRVPGAVFPVSPRG